jgi:hypothetical protein
MGWKRFLVVIGIGVSLGGAKDPSAAEGQLPSLPVEQQILLDSLDQLADTPARNLAYHQLTQHQADTLYAYSLWAWLGQHYQDQYRSDCALQC